MADFPNFPFLHFDYDLHFFYSISTDGSINDVVSSILRVITVEPYQYGAYECKAENKLGAVVKKVELFGRCQAFEYKDCFLIFFLNIFHFGFISFTKFNFYYFFSFSFPSKKESVIAVYPWRAEKIQN